MRYPLIRPNPPKLSKLRGALESLEDSGIYSNNGPVLRRFESQVRDRLFGGRGECLGVANATLGLMLAIRHEAHVRSKDSGIALMPSFTFAATAQAAMWAGLTPMFCDIDPDSWCPSPESEERLLRQNRGRVAVIVPYATFGNPIDLDRYIWLGRRHEAGVVVDAAASLGARDERGLGFGTGAPFSIVFSMHATKTFATAEGGLIYSADTQLIHTLREMANFGFGEPRTATMPGLNAKLGEINALLALEKLGEIDAVVAHRTALAGRYRARLPDFQLQQMLGESQSPQFMPLLLPEALAPQRAAIMARMAELGIGVGTYFSPHLAEQPWFRERCRFGPLPVTDAVAARMLSLPIVDQMAIEDVDAICDALRTTCLEAATGRLADPADVSLPRRAAGGRA
ncbi:DegT/DnrJ/EryC1/StrS family aminotransferase [Flavisphingomonas formosensis]|uniref:DegT/DnrJ/EryC1/StrS family aminotransferase n=1 Tax=Flavisphingomonas formosensis TaxID=861534 RepID=UPI001E4F0DEC|nr:DegT/DnrJ/EryC1/StrS family aminotransferase [Sphingomonas formosensis]